MKESPTFEHSPPFLHGAESHGDTLLKKNKCLTYFCAVNYQIRIICLMETRVIKQLRSLMAEVGYTKAECPLSTR